MEHPDWTLTAACLANAERAMAGTDRLLRRRAMATETTDRYPVEVRERPKPTKKPKGGKK